MRRLGVGALCALTGSGLGCGVCEDCGPCDLAPVESGLRIAPEAPTAIVAISGSGACAAVRCEGRDVFAPYCPSYVVDPTSTGVCKLEVTTQDGRVFSFERSIEVVGGQCGRLTTRNRNERIIKVPAA